MARDNAIEEVRSNDHSFTTIDRDSGELPDDATGTSSRIHVDCPNCEYRFTFGEWTEPAHGRRAEPSCPGCDESFSVRVGSEFALVERDGWTVAVSVGREGSRR